MIPDGLRAAALRAHESLLGTGVGERTTTIVRGLGWAGAGALVAKLVAGATTIVAGRLLGPAEFGRANVALAMALWLLVPLLLGVPTALLHHAPRASRDERSAWAGTAVALLALSGTATVASALLLARFGRLATGVGAPDLHLAALWCAGFLPSAACGAVLSAFERFRGRALLEIAFALLYPAFFALACLARGLDASLYVTTLAAAFGLAGTFGLVAVRRDVRLRVPGFVARARALLSYGALAAGGLVALALVHATARLVAGRTLDADEVGIVSAYQGGSIQMVAYFASLGASVLVPIASRTPSRDVLFRKMSRLVVPVGLGGAAFHGVVLAACLVGFGREFPLRGADWAAYSVASGLACAQYLLLWYLQSAGGRGVLAASAATLAGGLVNVAACALLVPRFGTLGAGLSAVAAHAVGIAACYVPVIRRAGGAL